MAKRVYVLMVNDGHDKYPIAIFRSKPSDKKLASLEIAEGLDTVDSVRDAFSDYLFWEKSTLY
jgi:hypothetical protein